jgi:hypothetical protein
MNTYQPTDFLCALCGKPVDLTIDLEADENGKTVHPHCYFDQLTGSKTSIIRAA